MQNLKLIRSLKTAIEYKVTELVKKYRMQEFEL